MSVEAKMSNVGGHLLDGDASRFFEIAYLFGWWFSGEGGNCKNGDGCGGQDSCGDGCKSGLTQIGHALG